MKNIPIALQAHLQQDATSWCLLLRIECQGAWAGTVLGFTTLDAPLQYDDGAGVVTYHADNGFAPERLQANSEMDVDNTNLTGWVSDTGITEEQILAGIFDYAEVTIYRVNYLDLQQGHEIVAFGTCGETHFTESSWSTEWRSLTQQAKQPIGQVYSLTCRAVYGDERCGMPFVWSSGEVSGQASDTTRSFFCEMTQAEGWFAGGVLEWVSGSNAGAQMEVDDFTVSGADRALRLALPMPYPIEVGDTFRVRQDCDKQFTTCKAKGNVLNFRGEHLTPVADAALAVPGAYVKSVDSA